MKKLLFLKALFALILVCLLNLAISINPHLKKIKPVYSQTSSPTIQEITDNRSSYTNSQIPKYEKLEITFKVQTNAFNLQFPYDPNPPTGLQPNQGISVDAFFTPDNWQTTYKQPAFYYEDFEYQVKSGHDWVYPNGQFFWKVRFAPDQSGSWQYKIKAQDKDGATETTPQSFNVIASENKGFIKVSPKDTRYFEYDDGTYFPGLGYNMNWDHVHWNDPVVSNQENFEIMGQNGIQLIRHWLSQWGIYSSFSNPWRSGYRGSWYDSLSYADKYPGHDFSWILNYYDSQWMNPTIYLGDFWETPRQKPNTEYRVFIRYKIPTPLQGPRTAGYPYGLVARKGGWMVNDLSQLTDPCEVRIPRSWPVECTIVSNYSSQSPTDGSGNPVWSILDGTYTSSLANGLEYFYLTLQNVNFQEGANVYIDRVEIRENISGCTAATGAGSENDLSNRQCGPNIVNKPLADQLTYYDQKFSYHFDKVLELAKQNNIYFKLVIMEKNEYIQNSIDDNGNLVPYNQDNTFFYGNHRTMSKVRWLQQAWWRYIQARWGYSPNIHSWEVLNEGNPYYSRHYRLLDEFGKYMHCRVFGAPVGAGDAQKCTYNHPNSHLVTTSFWWGLPLSPFWQNTDCSGQNCYPNFDYVDVHQYMQRGAGIDLRVDKPNWMDAIHISDAADYYDAALQTQKLSMQIGAKQPYGAGVPIIRGEAGFYTTSDTNNWDNSDIFSDIEAIWLHKYLWGQINPGGLIESYFYEIPHILNTNTWYNPRLFDYRSKFGTYYRFIKDVPLSNGYYSDALASTTNTSLRVWGQKDLVNGNAHLWIANPAHTWKNLSDNVTITPLSSSVTLTGFEPNKSYALEWWNTYTGQVETTLGPNTATTDASGNLTFSISNLTTDLALKIFSGNPPVTPKEGDFNNDLAVNILDLRSWITKFLSGLTLFDYNKTVENFGL